MPSIRELGRVDQWWYSKVAPVLAISYSASLLYRVSALATARAILVIAFVGLCAGTYGHIVNDVFDIDVDRRAGKRNQMAGFASWQRFAFCVLAAGLGFAPFAVISHSRTSLGLLAAEFLLPTIYSIPPLRLKEHGALGVICDALGAHLVPCLFVLSVLAHDAGNPKFVSSQSGIAFVWFAGVWALCLGLIAILIHEFEDRENDLRSGIRTFATGHSFAQVRWPVSGLYIAELCAFAGMAGLLIRVAPLIATAAIVLALMVTLKVSRQWSHYRHYDEQRTTIQWWQFGHPLYEYYFPMAAALQCAWAHPALVFFPMLQIGVFAHTFRQQLPELRATPAMANDLIRQWKTWLLWGGRLDADPNAGARISSGVLPLIDARVEIEHGGTDPWNVRLVRPGLTVRAGQQYRVHLMVRADRERRILFGVWQDHAPWEGLGLCEEWTISSRWLHISSRFIARDDDAHGYLGLWLGGETGSVEVRRCSIRAAGRKIK